LQYRHGVFTAMSSRTLAEALQLGNATMVGNTRSALYCGNEPCRDDTMAGKYFEQLDVGATFEHQPGRTVTETDNLLFTALTLNPQPLHLDAEFARASAQGQILVNSIFTLGLVVGLSVGDTTLGTTIGNLGFDKTSFPNPVFIGDTIYARTVVKDKRESKSRSDRGIVTFEHSGINQRGELVVSCLRSAMMLRQPSNE
jgi:acyl dehydratase